MTELSNEYRELWQAIRLADSVERVQILADAIAASKQLSGYEISQLRSCVFERFKEATADNPALGAEKVLELTAYCIAEVNGQEGQSMNDLRMDRQRRRELLLEWVEQYDEGTSVALIEEIYNRALIELRENRLDPACNIISGIGYGSESLFSAIWEMIPHADSGSAWRLLNCLIWCGSSPSTKLWELLESLIQGRDPAVVVSAMMRLGDIRRQVLFPQIANQLIGDRASRGLHLTLSFWASTASDDSQEDTQVMMTVWETVRQHPMIVLLDSRIAPSLDLSNVIPDMWSWLESLKNIEDFTFRFVRIFCGVERCKAPAQLASWHNAISGGSLEAVQRLAISDVGTASVSMSTKADAKLNACRSLLMSGFSEIADVLQAAYQSDTDWHLHGAIAEMSCGIQIVPLPEFVRQRIELEFDETGDGFPGYAEADAALTIALSNGTREAFDALLNFGYTLKGGVLLSWIDTLCAVAYELRMNGEAGILESLCAKLSAQSKSRHRQMAARAFSFLGAKGLLDSTVIPSVLSALSDEHLPDYTRADLAHSLHSLPFGIGDEATRVVAEIAFTTDQPNLRVESTLFLIRQDLWAEYVERLWNLIGWGNPVEIPPMSKDMLEDWKCIIVAELYLRSPETFHAAVLQIIDNIDEDVCSRVCRILNRLKDPAPAIAERLIQRLKRGTSPFGSPAFLFSAIGHIHPEALLSSELWDGYETWIIGAKLECVRALRECDFRSNGRLDAERRAKLEVFCADSSKAVRREAVQAIVGLTSEESFIGMWRSWAIKEVPLWRSLLAAEAIEFLPKGIRANHGDAELNFLKYHRFRKVRDCVRETLKVAKDRDNAVHCREKLRTMVVGDNSEVLKLFPYGDAIAKIGNMEDHRFLLAFLNEHQELKLNSRVWLQEIINQIAKRLSKQNHEISHEWNSIYESFDGILDTNVGKLPAIFNLWKQPAANYREPGTWGGTAVLTDELRLDQMMQIKHCTICAETRSSGHAVVNRVDGAIVNLQGSGGFPEKQSGNGAGSS